MHIWKLSVKTYTVLLILTLTIAVLNYLSSDYFFKKQLHELSATHALHEAGDTENYFRIFSINSTTLLESIRLNTSFNNYIKSGADKDAITALFKSIISASENIFQIRFINSFGVEEIRVEASIPEREVTVTPGHELQDKSGTYYFSAATSLNDKEVWFSSLDLNMENYQVEKPYKPTIRAAMAIRHENMFQGVVVINYYMENLIEQAMNDEIFNYTLFDEDGYILVHHDKTKNWSRYAGEPFKIDEKFQQWAKFSDSHEFYKDSRTLVKKMDLPFANNLYISVQPSEFLYSTYSENASERNYNVIFITLFSSVILSYFFSKIIKGYSEDYERLRTLHEIIERQNSDLQFQKERFDLATEGGEYGLWDWDIEHNTMYFSDSWKQMLGYSDEDIRNTPEFWFELLNPDDENYVRELIHRHLTNSDNAFKVINRLKMKSGEYLWVMTNGKAKFDESGKPVRIAGFNTDVNQLKKMEENLSSLAEHQERKFMEVIELNVAKDKQMMHQSRLAQMGEMINMIAHQWRQPLTAISSTSNNLSFKLMMDNYDKDVFSHEIGLISEYAQHLSKTIDDFRNFFKNEKEKQESTIEEIIEATIDIISMSLSNHSIVLNKNYDSNHRFYTHPSELKQVVLNLIKNAEDILIEKDVTNRQIWITTYNTKKEICMEIQDNAGGIPRDIIHRVFDPYFSTKKAKDGTGLGLYMSKMIIEQHCRGSITVKNKDEGAVFTVILPKEES